MIIVSEYIEYFKNGILIITGRESLPCPVCGGRLFVHGTCKRNLRTETDNVIVMRLRVLECSMCGKTHRELPKEIVPYKRHDISSICTMKEDPDHSIAEPSVRNRLVSWLAWFLCYSEDSLNALHKQGCHFTAPVNSPLHQQLTFYVRLIVNSGMWIQHRSVMCFSNNSDKLKPLRRKELFHD